MKPFLDKLPLLILLTSFSLLSFGQDGRKKPWFFDDGGISERRDIIKTDIANLWVGDYGLQWEHRYSRVFSFELGLGKVSRDYDFTFPLLPKDILDVSGQPGMEGYSILINNRISSYNEHRTLFTIIGGRQLRFEKVNLTTAFLGGGVQFIIGSRLVTEGSVGMGFTFQHSKDQATYILDRDDKVFPGPQLHLQLGYLF
jgi:hypothetical protein